MSKLQHIIDAGREDGRIQVGRRFNKAREEFTAPQDIRDGPDLERVIGEFYQYMHKTCVSHGGTMDHYAAIGRARQIIERDYRRREETFVNAVEDAKTGLRGGLSAYVMDVLASHVRIDSWEDKVAIVKAIVAEYGSMLPRNIAERPPEQNAAEWEKLLRRIIRVVDDVAREFRSI